LLTTAASTLIEKNNLAVVGDDLRQRAGFPVSALPPALGDLAERRGHLFPGRITISLPAGSRPGAGES